MTKILKNTSQFFTSLKVKQLLFWLIVWAAFVYFDKDVHSIPITILKELSNTIWLALLINFNFQVLIPRFLNERKYTKYFFAVALSSIVVTPIKLTILYILQKKYGTTLSEILHSAPFHILSYIILMIGSTFFQIITDWALLLQEKKTLRAKTTQAELQALKNQINPHFLFNTLNNLYALTLKKSDDAPDVVLKLSDMMRYMLYEGNAGMVSLRREIEYLQNYIDLEKIRQPKHFEISFEITGEPGSHKIPPLLFLPFVENSIKHGLNNSIEKGYIHIKLTINESTLLFQVKNSINPTSSKKASGIGGVGIPNVKNRLKLLYPDSFELSILPSETEYDVSLKLNLLQMTTK